MPTGTGVALVYGAGSGPPRPGIAHVMQDVTPAVTVAVHRQPFVTRMNRTWANAPGRRCSAAVC